MTIEWEDVPGSVLEIARELISKYHKERGLLDARIGFIFRSEPGSRRGYSVIGHAQLANKMYAPLLAGDGLDFIIWLSKPDYERMNTEQRKALIDHELCHCDFSGESPAMRGHDIEEFGEILDRYGLWKHDLFAVASAMVRAVQPLLPGLELARREPGQGGVVRVEITPGNGRQAEERPEPEPELQVLVDLLVRVGVEVALADVEAWADSMRREAGRWAAAVHLATNGNNQVTVPQRPAWLRITDNERLSAFDDAIGRALGEGGDGGEIGL